MHEEKNLSIGIVIPTWKGVKHLTHCLTPLLQSKLKPRILIIDSSSNDGTIELAQGMGIETLTISQKDFNHGATRELGRKVLCTDIIVMMTQDAYPKSVNMLEDLVKPLLAGEASVSYARQIPHTGAGYFGSFARKYNYPSTSHIRSIEDVSIYGVYTFFCSNSCAAYLNQVLEEIGGFSEALFGEDTMAVAKLLHKGHRVAYVAEAEVMHSHDYDLKEEFKRHFDIGLSRASFQHLIETGGKDSKRGRAYAWELINSLMFKKPFLIPYALLQILVKFAGYQAGKKGLRAPLWIKKRLSSQKYYWEKS